MWELRFHVKNIDSVYTYLTHKYEVIDYFYPVDRYMKGKFVYILSIHVLEGTEENKKKLAAELKKNKKVLKFEQDENRLLILVKEEERFYELMFDPELYFPKPVVIRDGVEYWDVAAWDRRKLMKLVGEVDKWDHKLQNFELGSITKNNLKDIYFPRILPEVPLKQKKAFEIAVKNGYYKFPRKANLGELAKKMRISTQTFHEHLRKAEARLLPFFSENISFSN